jgi:hypothetical protein
LKEESNSVTIGELSENVQHTGGGVYNSVNALGSSKASSVIDQSQSVAIGSKPKSNDALLW